MNRLDLLAELQNLDTRIEENAQARKQLETRLGDQTAVATAREATAEAGRQEHDLRTRLHNLELEVKSLEEQIRGVGARLYGGRVTNAKELSGLTRDEEMLKRQKGELEDRMLELMAQIEMVEKVTRERQDSLTKISAARAHENDQDSARLAVLQSTAAQLVQDRERVRARIPPDDLGTYDGLYRSKKGRAVAHVKGTSCAACGYAIPSGLASRVRVGEELVFCVNCGRILVP